MTDTVPGDVAALKQVVHSWKTPNYPAIIDQITDALDELEGLRDQAKLVSEIRKQLAASESTQRILERHIQTVEKERDAARKMVRVMEVRTRWSDCPFCGSGYIPGDHKCSHRESCPIDPLYAAVERWNKEDDRG